MVAQFIRQPKSWQPPLRHVAGIGVLYFLVASATIFASSNGRNHAAIWLADAIVLAALLGLPRCRWALVLLAGLAANHLANDVTRGFHWAHILYGIVNIGQVWLAATLIRMHIVRSPLANIGALGRFVLWAGLVAPTIGAGLGSLVSWWIYDQPYAHSFIRWFASNSLGLMVGAPLLKAVFDGSLRESLLQLTGDQRRNMAAILVGFALLVYFTFSLQHLPLLFLPVSALVMVAIWLGRTGVMVAVVIVAIVATSVMTNNYGPLNLVSVDDFHKVTFFQVYLGFLLGTGLVVVTIVTSRADAMARLGDREHMLRQLLAHGKDVMLSFDAKGGCTFCAGPTETLLGLPADEIVGRTIAELSQRVAMPLAMLDAQECALRPPPRPVEFQLPGGRTTWIEGSMTPIIIEDCLTSSVVTLRDITSQRRQNDDLQRRIFTDPLTQILNRAGFENQVEEAWGSSDPVTLALIDLDAFKTVNDTYGHSSGDEVLVVVAEIIAAHTREGDAVGRIGGDEFAVLFRTGPEAALTACQRICQCVYETQIFATDRRLIGVTISCGVAAMQTLGDRRELFEAADLALYEVKHRGRNGVRLAA